jgi:hypothetical protein
MRTGPHTSSHSAAQIGPPWHTAAQWREINAAFAYLERRYGAELDRARIPATELQMRLTSLSPLMDELSRRTCPSCPSPCCRTAVVWFDFRDLLFLHLTDHFPPISQPLYPDAGLCRFLGPKGCRLPRLLRPWICTWYLCPAQATILRARRRCLDGELSEIKRFRGAMEDEFISVICGRSRFFSEIFVI